MTRTMKSGSTRRTTKAGCKWASPRGGECNLTSGGCRERSTTPNTRSLERIIKGQVSHNKRVQVANPLEVCRKAGITGSGASERLSGFLLMTNRQSRARPMRSSSEDVGPPD
jgi:hypothetical protein